MVVSAQKSQVLKNKRTNISSNLWNNVSENRNFINPRIKRPIPAGQYRNMHLLHGAAKFGVLNDFGIKVNVIVGPIGAASALKMSYAGITKGTTALGSMMMLAATRAGVADMLRDEIDRSHPAFFTNFQRAVPDMFDKAYRFVGEMEEIADFVGEDKQARQMYQAIAEFYTRIAADHEGKHEETGTLAAFLKKKD